MTDGKKLVTRRRPASGPDAVRFGCEEALESRERRVSLDVG